MKKPNIILFMAEDICANLGCYGDPNARTPRLDEFAKENIKFNYCYSAAPVCSAARSSLNIGMYGSSAGVGQHRSMNKLPDDVKNIGYYMQQAGYYTVISKTDFNYPLEDGYDRHISYGPQDSPEIAGNIMISLDEKPKEKPLFVIQTSAATHQSQYGYIHDINEHRATMPRLKKEEYQDRDKIVVPGYHFVSDESKEVWAQYHEKMTTMDRIFGEVVDGLKERGVYEDSILIFVGDNGHGIPEGKINLWDEGVHVPMIVHVPKEMEDQFDIEEDCFGRACNRLTSFVDFATTFLSVADADIPDHLQGRAFLGSERVEGPKDIFSFGERCDEVFENSRSVNDREYMYICDFALSPNKRLNTYQTVRSPWFVRSMIEEGYNHNISDSDRRSLFREIPRVSEQLFCLKTDKNQLNNLVEDEKNKEKVLKYRDRMFSYIKEYRDDALMLEPISKEFNKKTGLTTYEILRDDEYYPLDKLIYLWKSGMDGEELPTDCSNPCEKIVLTKFLADRGENQELVTKYLHDESETVCAYAAFRLGDVERLEEICKTTENFVLIMYIIDYISAWRDQRAEGCYNIAVNRCLINREFKEKVDNRFDAAMLSGINMLGLRLGKKIPDGLYEKAYWPERDYENTCMVLEELDRESK